MKRILSLSMFLFFTLLTFSQSVKINNIKYEAISATEAALVDGYEASGEVVIPEQVTIKGKKYKVVEIKEFAFNRGKKEDGWFYKGASKLIGITIPNSVINIGNAAFAGCRQLKGVRLSESINNISEELFSDCHSLGNILIPNGIEKIGDRAFSNSKLESLVIPNSVTEIGSFAFSPCRDLRHVSLPENLEVVSSFLFSGSILTEITIPDGVEFIKDYAFDGCVFLREVKIPNSVIYIHQRAFNELNNLEKAIVPDNLPINPDIFRNCPNLKSVQGNEILFPEWIMNEIIGNQDKYGKQLVNFAMIRMRERDKMLAEKKKNSFEGYINSAIEIGKISKLPSIEEFIKPKVEIEINEWQEKGEFESTAKWKQRVNETTRNEKVKELADKYKNEYKLLQNNQKEEYEAVVHEFYSMKEKNKRHDIKTSPFILSAYDADNESFMIKMGGENLVNILLPVNVDDAPSFKANWGKIILTTELKFVPNGDDVALTSVSFKHNGKTYTYDSNTQAKYAITEIDYNFKPIELAMNEGDNIDYTFNPLEEVQNVVASPRQDIAQNNNVVIERKKLSAGELSDVDVNVPVNSANATNTFAVIIGNENYSQVAKVPYAQNDAKVFAEYCKKTLGLPEKNIKCYNDATFGIMLSAIENIQNIAKAYKGNINVIFYYAGHGVPNESSNDAYLLPVDANGRNTTVCYPVGKLYDDLERLNAKRITVFLDACFSGAQRGEGMLASARGVAIKAKQVVPQGNMVVFSAASGDETAYPYDEKGHGLFTYYLLKKLKDTKGNVTLGELGNYICEKVAQEAVVTNGKSQTPTVVPSTIMGTTWKEWKLK